MKANHICNGTKQISKVDFKTFEVKMIDVECNDIVLYFSVDFNIRFIKIGECCIDGNLLELQKDICENILNKEIYSFRGDPPKYNGNGFCYEQVFSSQNGNMWNYFIKTPIHHLSKAYLINRNECQKEIDQDYKNKSIDLRLSNFDFLKKQKIVSAISNPYEIKISDVNFINKLLIKQLEK